MSNPIIGYDQQGRGAIIRYDVPLPGAHKGRRIVKIDVDLPNNVWKDKVNPGEDLAARLELKQMSGGKWTYNKVSAYKFFVQMARALQLPVNRLEITATESSEAALAYTAQNRRMIETPSRSIPRQMQVNRTDISRMTAQESGVPARLKENYRMMYALSGEVGEFYIRFTEALSRGLILKLSRTYTNALTLIPHIPVDPGPPPGFFVIETYEISSFFGDYGLGATKKTFTLLPGEEMKISLKTWKSSKRSYEEGSSILDSYTETAAEKFSDSMRAETTDKSTSASSSSWNAEAEASGSWGIASASVSGGASGEYSSGRESFASSLAETTSEHSKEASAKRETTVTSSSEQEEETGEERVQERTIRNVNMRRPLTFVFRELNQEYLTYFTLKNIKIGYFSGRAGEWREVPLYALRSLLEETLKTETAVEKAADQILNTIRFVRTPDGEPVECLMAVETGTDGRLYDKKLVQVQNGEMRPNNPMSNGRLVPPPSDRSWHYAFLSGASGYNGNYQHKPDGILTGFKTIVMRTESLVTEALLGQSDALDNFAMEVQTADAERRTLDNKKTQLGLDLINSISDPADKVQAYKDIFHEPKTSIS